MTFFFRKDEQLETLGDRVLEATWAEFPTLARNQIALTWIVYDPPVSVNTGGALSPQAFWNFPVRGYSYRGVERIYPASIVKLFYLVAIQEWLEKGMVGSSPEIERAMRDAIADSSNDATSLIVDVLSLLKLGKLNATSSIATINLSVGRRWRQSTSIKKLGVMVPMVANERLWGS
jgi:hypothetical protein